MTTCNANVGMKIVENPIKIAWNQMKIDENIMKIDENQTNIINNFLRNIFVWQTNSESVVIHGNYAIVSIIYIINNTNQI